jgi:hypothetical protein
VRLRRFKLKTIIKVIVPTTTAAMRGACIPGYF